MSKPKFRSSSANPAKVRGRPFQKGPDERRYKSGAKDPERLETERDFRQTLLAISRESIAGHDEQGRPVTGVKLEMLARVYWGKALAGEIDFGNAILDRMFGRPNQPVSGALDLAMTLSMDALTKSHKAYKAAGE